MNDIKVTVYLSTYNQEEYICEALDSILMQKTNFKYELLVADDCSTDKTQQIVLEYQKKYPEIIKTFFPNENLGGCKKLTECIDKGLFKGDYIAFLEGDDYWLNENRLQILVDFLDENPEYSRISHQRNIIDENGVYIGPDVEESILDKKYTIEQFLMGTDYPDFGSVFRNYFKEVGGKYNTLFLASKNVCDFQDMFITQDFGPVYVTSQVFGAYRYRCIAGESNYNSLTTSAYRCKDHINICNAVEKFYNGKYDLTLCKRYFQKRLMQEVIKKSDSDSFIEARKYINIDDMKAIIGEILYTLKRSNEQEKIDFLLSNLDKNEKNLISLKAFKFGLHKLYCRVTKKEVNQRLRGFVKK